MAKKIVAKTNISYGAGDGQSFDFAPGDEVNASQIGMTKKQLEELYDAGAIELQETADKREEEEKKEEEKPSAPASDSQETPTKSTPTKATPPPVK